MIVHFENLSELKSKLLKIDEKKRRVIILVGRHRSERTHDIAESEHHEWEKRGGITLPMPFLWTPEGFWEKMNRKKLTEKMIESQARMIPADDEIIDFLKNTGFDVPVVNFHSTPMYRFDENSALVGIVAPRSDSRIHTDGLESYLYHLGGKKGIHPSELNVEFHVNTNDRFSPSPIKFAHGALHPDYLKFQKITDEDLENFRKHHAEQMNRIIEYLAKNGLTKN